MFAALFILVVVLGAAALLSLSAAYRLLEARGRAGRLEQVRAASLDWHVPLCALGTAAAQVPSLYALALLVAPSSSGTGMDPWPAVFLLAVLLGPAVIAAWCVWVVACARVQDLTAATLIGLAGLPLVVEGGTLAVMWQGLHSGESLGRGVAALVVYVVGPLVTVFSLFVFGVCGMVAADKAETTRGVQGRKQTTGESLW